MENEVDFGVVFSKTGVEDLVLVLEEVNALIKYAS